MTAPTPLRLVLAAAALLAATALPAAAQYDRDGRYVPSPMGVPTDPYARPVPLYPGTPGRAVGTPIVPRGAIPAPPPVAPPLPREPVGVLSSPRAIPLAARRCAEGWSRSTGLSRVEFRRLCHRLRRR